MCSDIVPVTFPVCTRDQMSRAVRLDAVMKGKDHVFPPEWNENGEDIYWSFRGYLRREYSFHLSSEPTSSLWSVALRALGSDGKCSGLEFNPTPPLKSKISKSELCTGDDTVACCRSSLVDSDIEVLVETGFFTGAQACVIPDQLQPAQVKIFRAAEENGTPDSVKKEP